MGIHGSVDSDHYSGMGDRSIDRVRDKTNTGEHSSASVSGDCGGILHPTGICRNERHDGGSDKRKGHNITCIAWIFIRNRCRIRTGTSDEAFRTCGKDAFPISDVNPADPGTRSCTDYPLHHRGHQQEPHHHCRHLKFLSGGNQHTGRFQIRAAGKIRSDVYLRGKEADDLCESTDSDSNPVFLHGN